MANIIAYYKTCDIVFIRHKNWRQCVKASTFKRGIHPHDHKEHTNKRPVEYVLPNETVTLLMQQHIGAPANPIVKKGERVLLGQVIGEQNGFISSPVHATISGTVKDIKPIQHPNGFMTTGIVIENDGLYEEIETIKPRQRIDHLQREDIINIIKDAGIVGMGGAGFPTYVKLSPPPDKKIDHIIVNGAECEPYLTSDDRVMLEETNRIIMGLKVVLSLFPDAVGKIGIETNKPEAIKKMTDAALGSEKIDIVGLKPKYPQGAEKQLIYSITKREVPTTGLPADVGCIVLNIDTVVAIHRAIYRGRPLMRRIVTVSGGAVNTPSNIKVRIGMTYREVIEAAGGLKEEPAMVISGGPMMGVAMYNLDVPIVKASSSILCLSKEEVYQEKEVNCIKCGKCVAACPMNLLPNELNKFAVHEEEENFKKYKGMACIECGSCSYVCPSNRYLLQSIRTTRRTIMAKSRRK